MQANIFSLGKPIEYWGIYHVKRSKPHHTYQLQLILYGGYEFIKFGASRPQNFDGVNLFSVSNFQQFICAFGNNNKFCYNSQLESINIWKRTKNAVHTTNI